MSQCYHVEGDMQCISDAGHRGRHAMRPMAKPEVPVAETTEPTVVVTEDGVGEMPISDSSPLSSPPELRETWTPSGDDFISLKGKAYLPARRRIQWMRGLPDPHPSWTIDTEIVEHQIGTLSKPGPVGVGKVDKGFAVVRANIFDEGGRLIATGLKSEYSENFTDYLEKAETGAIARALAVAGYGTESAIDLDEGVDAGRIADSPVEVPARRVKLGPSSVPGVGRGGKTDGASVAQIRRVAELSRQLELGTDALASIMQSAFGDAPKLGVDDAANSSAIAVFLSERSGAEVGALIGTLEAALVSEDVAEATVEK